MKENGTEQRWDAEHYDKRIGFVSRLGQSLIGLLEPKSEERILDLGCGTGDLTHQISLSGAGVTGLDHSETMVANAKRKYPELRFVQADGEVFRLEEWEAQYDAVFSNAALHWMQRPEKAIESVWLSLRPGAASLVSCFRGYVLCRTIGSPDGRQCKRGSTMFQHPHLMLNIRYFLLKAIKACVNMGITFLDRR